MKGREDDTVRPPNTGALDFGRLPDLLGYQVRLAHIAMARRWAEALSGLEITQKQYTILYLIRRNPGCSAIDLGTAIGSDRATMMAVLAKLEERGLIVRTQSRADARRRELCLTERGADLMAKADGLVETHEGRHEAMLSDAELGEFRRLLQLIDSGP